MSTVPVLTDEDIKTPFIPTDECWVPDLPSTFFGAKRTFDYNELRKNRTSAYEETQKTIPMYEILKGLLSLGEPAYRGTRVFNQFENSIIYTLAEYLLKQRSRPSFDERIYIEAPPKSKRVIKTRLSRIGKGEIIIGPLRIEETDSE